MAEKMRARATAKWGSIVKQSLRNLLLVLGLISRCCVLR
jgi:hypothetical protein